MFKSMSFNGPASNFPHRVAHSSNAHSSTKTFEVEPFRHEISGLLTNILAQQADVLPGEVGFLVHYGVQRDLLMAAAVRAKSLAMSAAEVLLAEGGISEEHFYRSLARHLGLTYVDEPIRLGPQASFPETIHNGLVAIDSLEGLDYLAAPRGALIAKIIAHRSNESGTTPVTGARRPIDLSRVAITTPSHLSRLVQMQERQKIAYRASADLPDFDASLSAMSRPHAVKILSVFFCLAAILMFQLLMPHEAPTLIVSAVLCVAFFAVILMRLFATAAALAAAPPASVALGDDRLPVYSVVIALYREERMVAQLIEALDKIDYPALGSKLTKQCLA
jgi:glycosyltransferase XagB